MKKFKQFAFSVICTSVFIMMFNSVITKRLNKEMDKKDLTWIKHEYNQIIRDRGGILKDEIAKEKDLILLGSSELSSPVDQNPINMFPSTKSEYDVSILGRAYTQSLQHAAMLNSTNNLSEESKVALIVSMQWFESSDGIAGNNYAVNFSQYQFYKMMDSDVISNENKLYYAQRTFQLLKQTGEYTEERIYAGLYAKDSFISDIALTMLKPYYKFKLYLLNIKDKTQSYYLIKDLEEKNQVIDIKNIDWNEEYRKAEAEGASKVTNNDINVDDVYYDTYLKENYDSVKDYWKDVDILQSKEFKDYKFFLETSKSLNVQPLIILMPVNGKYYDHIGLNKEKREAFYNVVQTMAEDYGFEVLNLQNKEYEKYYLSDVMHLGWKGWLNVNEEISKYFSEK